ncbi:MAG: PAS domain S-box protein [Anaerolineae bacterium]|nr:PAS domain S-box protein [Anaerolineae bacterium]
MYAHLLSEALTIIIIPVPLDPETGFTSLLSVDLGQPLNHTDTVTAQTLIFGGIVGVLILIIAAMLMSRWLIYRRLAHLSALVRQISVAGQVSGAISVDGSDPIAELARQMNQMLAALRQSHDALRQSEERLRLMAESAQDIIYLYRFSPTPGFEYVSPAATAVTGYTPDDHYADPQLGFKLVHPDDQKLLQQAIQGRNPNTLLTLRWVRKDGKVIWTEQRNTPIYDAAGNLIAVQGIARDITERRAAQEEIRKLSLAVEQSPSTVVVTDTQGTIQYVNPKFTTITGYTAAEAIGQNMRLLKSGETPDEVYRILWQTITSGHEWHGELCNRKKNGELYWEFVKIAPVIDETGRITRYLGIKEDITEYKRADAALREARDHLERRVQERTAELVMSNVRLEQEIIERGMAEAVAEEQRALAEALRDTASALTSTLNFEEVLDRILANLGRVVQHNVGNIMLVEDDMVRVARWRGYSEQDMRDWQPGQPIPLAAVPRLQRMIETGQPLVISDLDALPDYPPVPNMPRLRSFAGVPIRLEGKVIGFLNLDSHTPGNFTAAHAERLRAFADQAAIAIQNARLYSHAQELAAIQERQRLARELHDAVSQSLFSANMIAETLPRLWERNPKRGQQALAYLRQLTKGALAEMRTLLLELRPATLLESDLSTLLRQLAEAAASRKEMDIACDVEGQTDLPGPAKVAFYRIAQEAVNNTVKHAHASQVAIKLTACNGVIELHIGDNGRGFDPVLVPATQLGLKIMRERAEAIGAALEINTQPGKGTQVAIRWTQQPALPER